MRLTLDEIIQHEDRLQSEILEKECLLAAFKVLHGHAAQGQSLKAGELGAVGSAPLLPAIKAFLLSSTPGEMPSPAAVSMVTTFPLSLPQPGAPPPPAPPAPPPMNPELKAIGNAIGSARKAVWWAIQQMTDDFAVSDLAALFEREHRPIKSTDISGALSWFRKGGKIEQARSGSGRRATVFRALASGTALETTAT